MSKRWRRLVGAYLGSFGIGFWVPMPPIPPWSQALSSQQLQHREAINSFQEQRFELEERSPTCNEVTWGNRTDLIMELIVCLRIIKVDILWIQLGWGFQLGLAYGHMGSIFQQLRSPEVRAPATNGQAPVLKTKALEYEFEWHCQLVPIVMQGIWKRKQYYPRALGDLLKMVMKDGKNVCIERWGILLLHHQSSSYVYSIL